MALVLLKQLPNATLKPIPPLKGCICLAVCTAHNASLKDFAGSGFILIALMFGGGIGFFIFGGVLQWVWAVFHVLVITLQAFIFAVLTIVYLAQAHDSEEH